MPRLLMSVDSDTSLPCVFIHAYLPLCRRSTVCSCSTRVKGSVWFTAANFPATAYGFATKKIHRFKFATSRLCPVFLPTIFFTILFVCRAFNMPLCVGLPLRGRGGDAEHDSCHAEGRPAVVWAQSRRSGMVDTQHQYLAQNGGEGIRKIWMQV